MLFAIICTDKPGSADTRQSNRPAHVEFLKGLGNTLKFAGPFLTDDGAGMDGSLLVLEAADRGAAQAIAARDPYAVAGLFEKVEIRPWKWTINNPQGA
jgi:hypothetical protein